MKEETIINESILGLYYKEINKHSLLTPKEEIVLIKRIQKGDQLAKEKLILSHLKFVVKTAKRYQHRGLSLSDLINEGNLGLMYAITKFDLRKKVHFISYAVFWIKAYLTKAIIEQSKTIRLPTNKNSNLNQIKRYIKFIQETESRTPEALEISKQFQIKINLIKNLIILDQPTVLLDSPLIAENSNSKSIGDKILNSSTISPSSSTINQFCKSDINKVLSLILKPKEIKIIEYRFGLNENKVHSLSQTGDILGLTKERIRQIQNVALDKLRKSKQKNKLKDYHTI